MNSVSVYEHDYLPQKLAYCQINTQATKTQLIRFEEIEDKRKLKYFNLIAYGCCDELTITI